MPDPSALIVGLILTFGGTDGSQLSMTVVLTSTAPATLQWGALTQTSSAARRHTFVALPAPGRDGVDYVLKAGPQVVSRRVAPAPPEAVVLGVIGDGGPGAGPRGVLFERLEEAAPTAVVAIGDPLGWHRRQPGRRARSLSLTSRVPVVSVPSSAAKVEGKKEAWKNRLHPVDPVRDRFGLPSTVYHLRLGSGLLVVLDPKLGFGADDAQMQFLRAVSDVHSDATWRLAFMGQGPLSSGPRGPHPTGPALLEAVRELGFQVVVSGQDRLYERLHAGRTMVIVSGATGGVVDARARVLDKSFAMVAAPHWVRFDLSPKAGVVRAFGLEGALIDRVRLPPDIAANPPPIPWPRIIAAAGLLILGLVGVAFSLLRPGRGPR